LLIAACCLNYEKRYGFEVKNSVLTFNRFGKSTKTDKKQSAINNQPLIIKKHPVFLQDAFLF
jgi:hypothetical protein